MLGQPVPEFSLPPTGNSPFSFASARGARPVLCKDKFQVQLRSHAYEARPTRFGVMKQKSMCHAQEVLSFVKDL